MANNLSHLTNIIESLQRRNNEIKVALEAAQCRLSKAPAGKIRIAKKKNNVQFFIRDNSKDISGRYICKKDKKTIKGYLQKYYDEKIIRILSEEFQSLTDFLTKELSIQREIESIYSELHGEIKDNISPVDMANEDFEKAWIKEPYFGKEIINVQNCFQTIKGETVRSKSELTIANSLFHNNIPYKYECPLKLKSGLTVHPDFTVLNTRNKKIFYWEHRGMMDDRDYSRQAVNKLKEYETNGFLIGRDLIITEETSYSPLTPAEIELIIKNYF